jgi:putative ABC transport system permease protein
MGAAWIEALQYALPPWTSQDVTPDFFDVIGIPIIAGRAFRESDDDRSEPVIILGEVTAKNLWGVDNAVGKRMRFGEDDPEWRRVIGVAADAYPIERYAFNRQAFAHFAKGIVYRPLAQVIPRALNECKLKDGTCVGFRTGLSILVKGPNVEAVAPQIRAVVARSAPGEDFKYLGSLARYLDVYGEIELGEFTTNLLIGFSVGGFILALLGAIVLIDEVVRNRTSEIGIRRALGAQSASLVILASRETFVAGMAGVVAGSLVGLRAGSFVATWMKANPVARLLPPPTVSYALVAATAVTLLILLAVGTAARAIRAARLDPAVALRIE